MHAEHAGEHMSRDPLVVDLAEAMALDVRKLGRRRPTSRGSPRLASRYLPGWW
jgi:hypothetical protein